MMNMFRFLCVLGLIAIVNVEGAPITGPNCVSSCSGRPDGDYQSCNGCNVYVTCFGGGFIIDNRPCAVSTLVWDDNVKRCEYTSNTCSEPAITCQQPATIAHASMDPVKQEYNQDDTVTYTCDPGYSGSGDTVVTCSDIGVWSATALVCQPITCQQPAIIAHASMDPVKQEYNLDDTVTYTCDPGYSGSGDAVVTCSDPGVWSATALVCQLSDSCTAITTPNAYSYVDIAEIDGNIPFTFTFKVKACNDVHVGFYAASSDAEVYEIVIAGWGNSQSVIRTRKQGTNHVTVAGARLSCSEFRGFWISYNDGHIKVGEGNVVGNHEFMNYDHSSQYSGIAWIGITTGFGATGEWCYYGAQQ